MSILGSVRTCLICLLFHVHLPVGRADDASSSFIATQDGGSEPIHDNATEYRLRLTNGVYQVCLSSWSPLVYCDRGQDSSTFSGYQVELIRSLARSLNWTELISSPQRPASFPAHSNDAGAAYFTLRCMDWTPMIQDLLNTQNGTCFMSAAGVTPDQGLLLQGVKFAWPSLYTGLRILVPEGLQFGELFDVFRALHGEVWMALGLTVAGMCVISWMFDVWYRYIDSIMTAKLQVRAKAGSSAAAHTGLRSMLDVWITGRVSDLPAGLQPSAPSGAASLNPPSRKRSGSASGGLLLSAGSKQHSLPSPPSLTSLVVQEHPAANGTSTAAEQAMIAPAPGSVQHHAGTAAGVQDGTRPLGGGPADVGMHPLLFPAEAGEMEGEELLPEDPGKPFFEMAGAAVWIAWPDPPLLAHRIVVFFYGLLLLVTITIYGANTAAYLTQASLNSKINSKDDLPGQAVGTWEADVNLLKRSGIAATGLKWEDRSDEQAMLDTLRNGTFAALVLDSAFVDYIASSNCEFRAVGRSFERSGVGLAFPPGTSDVVVDVFSWRQVRLQESGMLLDSLDAKYMHVQPAVCSTSPPEGLTAVKFREVHVLWLFLGVAVLTAAAYMLAYTAGVDMWIRSRRQAHCK